MKCSTRKGWVHRCKPVHSTVFFTKHIQPANCLTLQLFSKLAATLFILFYFQVHAQAFGQGNITLSVKDAPVEQVFKELKKQSGYGFVYPSEVLDRVNKVTLTVRKASLEEVLNLLFRDQLYTYSIIDKIVIIRLRDIAPAHSKQQAPSSIPIDVTGKVTNEKGEPLPGVTVTVKGTNKFTSTDVNGLFSISSVDQEAVLLFSSVNMEPFELKVSGKTNLAIRMKAKVRELDDVTVMVNTGYEKVPKERATGSFEFVNNEELNRKVGTDILSRLEGVTTSVLFDRRQLSASQSTIAANNILIRGLSTLSVSMKSPLIIVNNFPWEGNINNINPNDVENITILKDAAAASIWGARAANGVIVITTKKGQYNQTPRLSLNTNLQIAEKPDLFYYPKMTSTDFIDVESFLFSKGFYNSTINSLRRPAISPVIEILWKRRSGLISSADSAQQINALRNIDVRNSFEKYVYRAAVNQQYFLNLTGGSQKVKYSLSGGFDKNLSGLVGNESRRITLRSENVFVPVQALELNFGVTLTSNRTQLNSLGEIGNNYDYFAFSSRALYPYAQFADNAGNALELPRHYRMGYTDTAGGEKLLDWKFRPLDELAHADNRYNEQEIVLNLGTTYQINRHISAALNYQYQRSNNEFIRHYSLSTYEARNLINRFTQIKDNEIIYNIPKGGILDQNIERATSHIGRGQINYNQTFKSKHQINGLIGAEIRQRVLTGMGSRLYGYNANTLSSAVVDYITSYTLYGNLGSAQIPTGSNSISKRTDRFASVFSNAAYTYNNLYTLSASARRDAANLFGIDINDKWNPFWSIGGSWNISNEPFFKTNFFHYLRLRTTYGYQGNVNNSLAPYTIISHYPAFFSPYNLPGATITVPANPGLSWETIKQLNVGADFQIMKNRITGSIDVYTKKSNNLIWDSQVDQTTGVGSVARNSAGMTGKGIDIMLRTLNTTGSFKWHTEWGFSYITNKVTDYKFDDSYYPIEALVSGVGLSINPVRGIAPYALFSYPFAGLNPSTGDPQGYIGKTVSTDYLSIANANYDTANVNYHGSAIPTIFGNFNNLFSFKGISLIININYRLGYYFRKRTISYSALYNSGTSHGDYAKRWIKPGDETKTTVPSMIYPLSNSRRDMFYAYSSANVFRGDNIRLQNIRISYALNKSTLKNLPLQSAEFYVTIENLGIIWRSNREGLDPDYDAGNAAYPPLKRLALGIKLDF